MDGSLLIAILVAIGLPAIVGLIIGVGVWNEDKIKDASKKAKDSLSDAIGEAKGSISDAIERHKDTNTVEYQEELYELLKAGYTEEQAKAMLKTRKKIEQLKRKDNS